MPFKLTPSIRVEIDRNPGLVSAFFDFLLAQRVYSIRGGGSSGPGWYVGFFDAEDAPALQKFFETNGKKRHHPKRKL